MTVEVKGLKETSDKLKALANKVEKSIVRKGLRQGGKILLNSARSLAPVQSGRLKRNIKIRNGRSQKDSISLSVGVSSKDFQGETYYASFVLYGHRIGSRKLGDSRKEIPPNDFLLKAFDDTKDEVVAVTTDAWAALIEQEAS